MTLQHISQTNACIAPLVTAGLLVLQATIATTTISTFASTQPISAQAMTTK